jgi:transcriptional regulator with XRE-family HTH domain
MSETAPDTLDISLGRCIRQRRKLIGMTQRELGARSDLTFQQVQKYEKGANRVSFSRLVQLARALQCHPAELVTEAAQTERFDSAVYRGPSSLLEDGAPQLLEAYAELSPTMRDVLRRIAAALRGRSGVSQ